MMWNKNIMLGVLACASCLAAAVSAQEKTEPAAAPAGAELEAIKIILPEAFFGGTPLPYAHPQLEPKSFKARPPFMAPKGTAVVSKGKPVTSSVPPNRGTLEQITDGDKDYVKSSLVEMPEGTQWVQVDLGESFPLYAILLWHFHEGDRVYFDTLVQASDDPEFKTGVTTLYNNDFDNSSGMGVGQDKEYIESNKGRLIDAKGTQARYVRCYSKGNTSNDFNNYIEIEIFGKSK